MGQERLSSLALLHIEREYVNKVLKEDMAKMIDVFGQRSGRNKYFFKRFISFSNLYMYAYVRVITTCFSFKDIN